MIRQLIADEKFTNIQRAQAGLTKLFQKASKTLSFYRVLKNDKPLGILMPQEMWENLLEDMEALASSAYLKRIAASRRDKRTYTIDDVKKTLHL